MNTPTERLRAQVVERMAEQRLSMRQVAIRVGIDHTCLYRFLTGGLIRSDTFDALHAWLATAPVRVPLPERVPEPALIKRVG